MKKTLTKEVSKKIANFAPKTMPAIMVRKETSKVMSKKIKWVKMLNVTVLALVVLGFGVTAFYFYHKYKTVPSVETDDIVAKVGKLMYLPGAENPTLATVTDIEKVKDQAFFAKSENGDKVLIYIQAKKAILYRPSANKIVDITILSTSGTDQSAQKVSSQASTADNKSASQAPVQDASTTADAQKTVSLNVAVYNGSKAKGLAGTIGDKISKIDGMTVTQKTNAIGIYAKNLVVDISGNNADSAQKIADMIGGTVGSLPSGEAKPNADILVLAGTQ